MRKLRIMPRYQGRVSAEVLLILLEKARYITAKVVLTDDLDVVIGILRADVLDAVKEEDDREVYWVSWNGRNQLGIDPTMSEESSGTFPADVWQNPKASPPERNKK